MPGFLRGEPTNHREMMMQSFGYCRGEAPNEVYSPSMIISGEAAAHYQVRAARYDSACAAARAGL